MSLCAKHAFMINNSITWWKTLVSLHKHGPTLTHDSWKTLLSLCENAFNSADSVTGWKPLISSHKYEIKPTHTSWNTLLPLCRNERIYHRYRHHPPSPLPYITHHLNPRFPTIAFPYHPPPLSPSYWNIYIEYSEVSDSTKGYPGEGPPTEKQNKNIKAVHTERTEAKTFDSTKGYPGEGPEIRREKKEITAQYGETNYGTKH